MPDCCWFLLDRAGLVGLLELVNFGCTAHPTLAPCIIILCRHVLLGSPILLSFREAIPKSAMSATRDATLILSIHTPLIMEYFNLSCRRNHLQVDHEKQ